MDKAQFEIMITKLVEIVDECKDIKDKIFDTNRFDNLTIKEARSIVERAKAVQSKQDKIFQTELYHIIGMGDLTPSQECVFLRLVKELGQTRNWIHSITAYTIQKTPDIPCKADYNCKTLGVNLNVKMEER